MHICEKEKLKHDEIIKPANLKIAAQRDKKSGSGNEILKRSKTPDIKMVTMAIYNSYKYGLKYTSAKWTFALQNIIK